MRKTLVFICVCAFLLPSIASYGQMEEIKAKLMEALKNKASEAEDSEGKEEKKEEEDKGYDKLLEGFMTQEGVFKVHVKEDKVYFEIPDSLFGRDMLLASRVSEISNNKDFAAGQMPRNPMLIRFSKDAKKVFMHLVNTDNLCDESSAIYKSFQRNYLNPIWQDFDIKAMSPDSTGTLIDVSKFFCSDSFRARGRLPFSNWTSPPKVSSRFRIAPTVRQSAVASLNDLRTLMKSHGRWSATDDSDTANTLMRKRVLRQSRSRSRHNEYAV